MTEVNYVFVFSGEELRSFHVRTFFFLFVRDYYKDLPGVDVSRAAFSRH